LDLPASVLDHLELGIAAAQLVDAGDDDLELNPQLGQDLPPLRGSRR